jgi:hypothetical protein
VFNALLGSLDEAARGLLVRRLQPSMPAKMPDQNTWFDPYLRDADRRMQPHYEKMTKNLKPMKPALPVTRIRIVRAIAEKGFDGPREPR